LFAASTPRKPLLSHFISPIWVQYEWCYHARKILCGWFGQVMSSWHCRWPKVWQISLRAKPKPMLFAASTPRKPLCWAISFPPYGSNEWC
jgi:hypothetical protein